MTLRDLWIIVHRNWKVVVFAPILCALLLAGVVYAIDAVRGSSYTASSKLMVTDPTGLVGSSSLANLIDTFAQEEVESAKAGGIDAKAESDSTSQSIEFTVTSSTVQQAVELANGLAEKTKDATQTALSEQGDAFLKAVNEIETSSVAEGVTYVTSEVTASDRAAALRSCSYAISDATISAESVSSDIVKYLIAGYLAGLFLTICALALIDSLRQPIKNKGDIQRITDIPVLSEGHTAKSVERLWANLCFVTNEEHLRTVCVLPASGDERKDIDSMLEGIVGENSKQSDLKICPGENPVNGEPAFSVKILGCDSIQDSVTGAQVARSADATVLVVRPWVDRADNVIDVLDELKLAQARIAGILLA